MRLPVFLTLTFFLSALLSSSNIAASENAEAQNDSAELEIAALRRFADPALVWGEGAERYLEEAYRRCFTTRIIGGRVMNIRIPFAENHERDQLVAGGWEFLEKGKASPSELWPVIERTFSGEDFEKYAAALGDGREKVIIFDIPNQTWRASQDIFDIARMKAGDYRGLPHSPQILSSGRGILESDVYNYLYCIAWTGMDCSAFVWYALSYTVAQKGRDLDALMRRALGMPRGGRASFYAGTAFFGSRSSEIAQVDDKIRNLKPADILLFRAADGTIAHSAVIQSVDLKNGIIRYLQSTDEAPAAERGVHESFIHFPIGKTNLSLEDPQIEWTQKRRAPFAGERPSAFPDDGVRYRAFGGGKVVRLKQVTSLLKN